MVLRYALRSLSRSRGFAALVISSLSIAIGLITTAYAMIDAVRFPYVPYREPDQVKTLSYRVASWAALRSVDVFEAVRDAELHQSMAAFNRILLPLQAGLTSQPAYVSSVSANFLDVLGIAPSLGRSFDQGEGTDQQSVIVSDGLWRRMFAGRSSVEGATLRINDSVYTVIGVMPRGMSLPWGTVAWRLLPPRSLVTGLRGYGFTTLVRLKPDVTVESANAKLAILATRFTSQFNTPFRFFSLAPVRPDPLGFGRDQLILAGASVILLLVACANAANMMLARGVARRRELAIRKALGASQGSLVGQLVAEAAFLAMGGGVIGVFAAVWGMDLLANHMPAEAPFVGGGLVIQLNWRIFAFALAAISVCVLVFGLGPAMQASRVDLSTPLKESSGGASGRVGARYSPLVMSQIALSMILLLAAGVLVRVVHRMASHDFGYDPRGLAAVEFNLRPRAALWRRMGSVIVVRPDSTVPSGAELGGRIDHALARMRGLPGVRAAAALVYEVPHKGIVTSDLPGATTTQINIARVPVVTNDFLRVLGIRVARGRDFEPGDEETAGAVIINAVAARALWPNADPVGRLIKLGGAASSRPWLRVVGIVEHARLGFGDDAWLPEQPNILVVTPTVTPLFGSFVVRITEDDPDVVFAAAREAEATLLLQGTPAVGPWLGDWESSLLQHGYVAALFLGFAGYALALGVIGLFAVLSYAVGQRMREFAIRLALGATPRNLARIVLHDGLVMLLGGTAAGAFVAMYASQYLERWLYTLHPADAPSLIVAELVLTLAALGASIGPARRAMKADPVEILRAV